MATFPSESGGPGAIDDADFEREDVAAEPGGGLSLKLVGLLLPIAALALYFTLGTRDTTSTAPGVDEPIAAPAVGVSQEEPEEAGSTGTAETEPAMPLVTPDTLTIEMRPEAPCWVEIVVDGRPVVARLMQAGEREVQRAEDEIVLQVGDGAACGFVLNNFPGRALGAQGEVVEAVITRENFRSFLAESAAAER